MKINFPHKIIIGLIFKNWIVWRLWNVCCCCCWVGYVFVDKFLRVDVQLFCRPSGDTFVDLFFLWGSSSSSDPSIRLTCNLSSSHVLHHSFFYKYFSSWGFLVVKKMFSIEKIVMSQKSFDFFLRLKLLIFIKIKNFLTYFFAFFSHIIQLVRNRKIDPFFSSRQRIDVFISTNTGVFLTSKIEFMKISFSPAKPA